MGSRVRTAVRKWVCPLVLYGLPSGRRCLSLVARRRAVQGLQRLPVVMMVGQSMQVRPARGTYGRRPTRISHTTAHKPARIRSVSIRMGRITAAFRRSEQ